MTQEKLGQMVQGSEYKFCGWQEGTTDVFFSKEV